MKSGSISRIQGLLLRYLYVLRSSWPRIIEISYWPTMQLIIWGFVSLHFGASQPEITASGILISVVLVWDSLFRSHVSYTLSFLEEMWSVFDMGLPLLAFFFNLVFTGWAISQVVTGILIRYGLGAESLTWVVPFMIAPVSCIYYPLSTLPPWLQEIAQLIPTSYVFEGMRALVLEGQWRGDLLQKAFLLNCFYFVCGVCVFLLAFRSARKQGLLLQTGE